MELENQPATKADVQPETAGPGGFDERFSDQMDVREQRTTDSVTVTLRQMETRLIGAFQSFAEVNNRRATAAEWIRFPPLS